MFELLDTHATVRESPNARALPTPVRGAVTFERVSFRYADDLPEVIRGLTLHMAPGEVMAVVGKKIEKAFYGADAKHSYYTGCSTGGQQGLVEAQYYPEDFDGIIAGAPVLNPEPTV